jgi:hypothetical protein
MPDYVGGLMSARAGAREHLVGWMILEDYCEDMSAWDGVISFPDPTGANLAWLNPTKMIEYSAFEQMRKERDDLCEYVSRIQTNYQREEDRLRSELSRYKRGLERMAAMCGAPDAAQGCRNILAEIERILGVDAKERKR